MDITHEARAALVAVASLAIALPAGAADYHVCNCLTDADGDCAPGDDGNDGTTSTAAWRTYDKAQDEFSTLAPGDSILFCRGGAFEVAGGSRWVNTSCRADAPCTVSDYEPAWTSGDEQRPIIWLSSDAHAFALEDGGDAEHEEGYVFSNLDMRCTVCESTNRWAFFLYNDIDDVVIDNVLMDGFDIGVHLAGSNACSSDPDCDGRNSRLTLRNCTIVNSISQGFLGSGDSTVIENNTFENNGSREIFDHNIYYSGGSHPSTGSRIVGNELLRSDLDSTGSCAGVSLVVHGTHADLTIEGNLVHEEVGAARPGCWGIAVDGGYDEAESFTNVAIRGNEVRNVGNVAIGISSCVDCVIENNVIVSEQEFGVTAIAAPDRSRGDGDATMTNVDVRNNSIYMATTGGTGIHLADEGSGHMIVSNAVHFAGSGGFLCLDADLPEDSYEDIDHNLCYFPSAAGLWNDGAGTDPDPLSAWQASSGFDTHSMLEDPGFSSPSAPAFDLSASSESAPIVDSGHPTLSSPVDIMARVRDDAPDIGAFEFGAVPPAEGEEPEPVTDAGTDPDVASDMADDEQTDAGGGGDEARGCGCRLVR